MILFHIVVLLYICTGKTGPVPQYVDSVVLHVPVPVLLGQDFLRARLDGSMQKSGASVYVRKGKYKKLF